MMESTERRGAEARIFERRVAIDENAVHAFFEARGGAVNPDHPLTSILYQDRNPGLAEARDQHERATITPLLRLGPDEDVIDIGCGIGRWGLQVAPVVRSYCGVDFSQALLDEAAKRLAAFPNITLVQSGAQSLNPEALPRRYSRVIVAGVLIYLNDEDVALALAQIVRCAAPSALLYFREPVAREVRLTLDRIWSEDLSSQYSAIYRTGDELRALFSSTLEAHGFRLTRHEDLYPADSGLNNRRETVQTCFFWERP